MRETTWSNRYCSNGEPHRRFICGLSPVFFELNVYTWTFQEDQYNIKFSAVFNKNSMMKMKMKMKFNTFTPLSSVCALLLISASATVVNGAATYQWHFCSNTSGNYTPSGTYQVNINMVLFGKIRGGVLSSGFSTGASGEGDDRVYGLGLCRGDIPPRNCETCIYDASAEILPRCLGRKEAFIWYDECMVRYSNRSFFGRMETSPVHSIANPENMLVDDENGFAKLLTETMSELGSDAASNISEPIFSTKEAVYANKTVFELAECTRDISRNDCRRCLQTAVDSLPSCCRGSVGATVILPSCYLRYDTYKFYDQEIGAPAPSPLPPPFGNRSGGSEPTIKIIIFTALAAILVISSVGFYTCYRRGRKQKREGAERNLDDETIEFDAEAFIDYGYSDQMNANELPLVPLSVMRLATNNFTSSNKLGEGGFGQVYKATLHGKEVAAKRLVTTSTQGLEEFKNEVMLIAKLQHRNLVRLLGYCMEDEEKVLIYEYMPNTSLDAFLFDDTRRGQLDWEMRFNIISGIARGILYLHEDSRLRIIHRDLKTSNVLLDNEMNPKISDFGMARIFGGNQKEGNTNRVVGTYGYMAPEYAMQGLFSIKSDVYSFGVLLLEIISGKRNSTTFFIDEHAHSLLTYAWKLWGGGKGAKFIDPLLRNSFDQSEVLKCMHIGLLCVQEDAYDRPTMSSVVVMFASYSVSLPEPKQPALSVGRLVPEYDRSSHISTSGSANDITISDFLAR